MGVLNGGNWLRRKDIFRNIGVILLNTWFGEALKRLIGELELFIRIFFPFKGERENRGAFSPKIWGISGLNGGSLVKTGGFIRGLRFLRRFRGTFGLVYRREVFSPQKGGIGGWDNNLGGGTPFSSTLWGIWAWFINPRKGVMCPYYQSAPQLGGW